MLVENDRELTGFAEGSVASAARPQLVAAAALDAVRQGEPAAEAIHITSAEISRIGSNRVASRHRRLRRSADASSSSPVRQSCAAIGTTPSRAHCSTPPTVVSPAPNAAERPG